VESTWEDPDHSYAARCLKRTARAQVARLARLRGELLHLAAANDSLARELEQVLAAAPAAQTALRQLSI
jgi:hypothetical protein